ncbi:relaxase/mobilization nuclease domain-containing protein [Alistipes putredinis]|uniref:relaxase/mobilization nuclease domain-containing protein n=1 Tax=Alistipes putredinis TaxID=28117 RepID=UPI003AB203F7
MIGKVISGSSFSGTVGYVMKEESRILEAEGIMPPDAKRMAEDFKDQTLLNPRLKNTVGHISLSFSPKDAPRMTDALMTQIAKEYMQKMGIADTQYLLVRHLDQPHPHCHLVYNRVGNDGQTISDKNIKIRNAKVCRELTEKYGLYFAPGKDDVRRERLREPDKTRYEIYDAIKRCLPQCVGWKGLEKRLGEQGIGVRYKYCGNTDRKQGVLFSKNGFEFSGSKIDRAFSFTKLDNRFTHLQQQALHRAELLGNLSTAAGNYRSAFAALFGSMGGGTREEPAAPGPGGKLDAIPLPPANSPGGVSAEQLQRKPGESPEEHIARITALLNAAAEAMAIAAIEHRRRLEEQNRKTKLKL